MKTPSQRLGAQAEEAAARHLKRLGFRIVERNLRIGRGELDLVVRKDDLLVFVEVKAGRFDPDFPPHLHLDSRKQSALLRLAQAYIAEHRHCGPCRIDLVTVTLKNNRFDIEHFVNVVS